MRKADRPQALVELTVYYLNPSCLICDVGSDRLLPKASAALPYDNIYKAPGPHAGAILVTYQVLGVSGLEQGELRKTPGIRD